jgi:hypothetical protein
MTYEEKLIYLQTSTIVPDEYWNEICSRIAYDAASTVPGSVEMLTIIRQRVMNNEKIEVPLIKLILDKKNFNIVIRKTFGSFILCEIENYSRK